MSLTSTSQIFPILKSMYEFRQEMVPMFIGDPGIGKTQGVKQLVEWIRQNTQYKKAKCVTYILSNTVPSEVSGIHMPNQETHQKEVYDDNRMASLVDGDVLFFDEFLEASPALWSATLTLIQDRTLASGRKLPDVFIVAASNRVASPGIIPASTRDRFQVVELEFSRRDWCAWFKKKYKVDATEISKKIEGDSNQYNILTPRRVEKLYRWLKIPGDQDVKVNLIEEMFDASVAEILIRMRDAVPSANEQVRQAVMAAELSYEPELPDNWDDMSLKDIMGYLQQLPEWDAIAESLARTEKVVAEPEEVRY